MSIPEPVVASDEGVEGPENEKECKDNGDHLVGIHVLKECRRGKGNERLRLHYG